jgi:hypothetical protein
MLDIVKFGTDPIRGLGSGATDGSDEGSVDGSDDGFDDGNEADGEGVGTRYTKYGLSIVPDPLII